MVETKVGRLLNFTYDNETKKLTVLIEITDQAFKEQILRNPELQDRIKFKGEDVICVASLKR